MSCLGVWLLALQATSAPAPAQAPAEPAAVAPYEGDLTEGLAELARRSGDGEHGRAVELAAALAAAPGQGRLTEPRRARLLHDLGLARARAGAVDEAVADLRAAAGLAGPGELRATSLYEAGTARLLQAETLRREVPEIAQRLGLPAPPAPPAAPVPGAPPPGPDALELARAAYLAARAELLERLRLDWRDGDTRANLELALKRLRELDEIEREREEDPQQQDPQDQQQQAPQDQQQGDPQDQPPEQQQEPQQQPEQPQEEPGEEQEPPEPQPDEQDPGQDEGQPEPAREEERVLSREEVLRLLDQLEQIEEQARSVRALLRERKRRPVEKDW